MLSNKHLVGISTQSIFCKLFNFLTLLDFKLLLFSYTFELLLAFSEKTLSIKCKNQFQIEDLCFTLIELTYFFMDSFYGMFKSLRARAFTFLIFQRQSK